MKILGVEWNLSLNIINGLQIMPHLIKFIFTIKNVKKKTKQITKFWKGVH